MLRFDGVWVDQTMIRSERDKKGSYSYLEKGEKGERLEARNIWQQSRSCIFETSAVQERDQKYDAKEAGWKSIAELDGHKKRI